MEQRVKKLMEYLEGRGMNERAEFINDAVSEEKHFLYSFSDPAVDGILLSWLGDDSKAYLELSENPKIEEIITTFKF